MKKMNIVKKNSDFTKIIAANLFVKDRNFVIYALPTEYPYARFGVSVGKKIGKAVTRNYYKRQIRNIIDNHKNLYSKSRDYIIIIRKNCLNVTYQNLEQSIISLMDKIDSLIESAKEN